MIIKSQVISIIVLTFYFNETKIPLNDYGNQKVYMTS